MNECCRCGVSGEKSRLFDAICDSGVVKVCKNCSSEDFLMIQRPTTFQLKDAEKKESYLKPEPKKVPLRTTNKEDISLRDIVDQNLEIKHEGDPKPRPDLIDNFHWTITRIRRARHISREQFARDLGESETLIKMVEKGILPEDDNRVINKIETYLSIKLRKPEFEARVPEKKELGFDSVSVRNLTISDLKEMKKDRGEEIFSNPVEVWEGDIEADSEEKIKNVQDSEEDSVGAPKEGVASDAQRGTSEGKEKDLSKKDMDDLIFGKKD